MAHFTATPGNLFLFGADVALRVLAGTHGAIGQHNASPAGGLEVVQHVLQPGVVGIALWRVAVHPTWVTCQAAVPPVADVEGWVGQNGVSPRVRVLVAGEGVTRFAVQIEVSATDGQVHRRHSPGGEVRFLPVN